MSLMTHIIAGYPSYEESKKIAQCMIRSKVAYLEIQIPFSDPIADGPVIMQANQKALQNGTTPDDAFRLMGELQDEATKNNVTLLFMSYYNILFRYGLDNFCKKAMAVGCSGLIIPDIPIDEEETDGYVKMCKKYDLNPIQVISPITSVSRLQKIQKYASGLVYCVSHTGLTGSTNASFDGLEQYINRVRQNIPDTPLALGFGISSHQDVKIALEYADIAVIGSEIIRIYDDKGLSGVESFLRLC